MGFAYDDPRVTPPERIRHSCSVMVEDDATLPDTLIEDGFEVLRSPAGLWAVVDRAPQDVGSGYRAILNGWFQRRCEFALEGDPHLEHYRMTDRRELIDRICIRVRPAADDRVWNMSVVPPGGFRPARP